MNKKLLLLIASVICLASCGTSKTKEQPKQLHILYNNEITKEVNIIEDDTISLSYAFDIDVTSKVTPIWSVGDTSIISLTESNNYKALNAGTTTINLSIKEFPSLSSYIFVNVSSKVMQEGVGTGFSKDDPLFIGNEGKEEPLEIFFIEMTQMYADSIYIRKGNVDILIDGGTKQDGVNVNKFLQENMKDNRLDLVIATHGDADHIAGLPNALKDIDDVSLFIDYGGVQSSPFSQTRKTYLDKGAKYYTAYDCVNHTNGLVDRFYLTSEFYVDILNTGTYCKPSESNSSNPYSVAALFTYKDFKFFSAGDLTSSAESSLMRNEELETVTLYKASHHGSHGSNTQELMNKLNPKGVAISAARPSGTYQSVWEKPEKTNTYNLNGQSGHPAEAAIERIYKIPNIMVSLRVYLNSVNGTMCFTSNGENDFSFKGSPTMKGYYNLELTNGTPVWNEDIQDFENKVTGEENLRLHETHWFKVRGYSKYLPKE